MQESERKQTDNQQKSQKSIDKWRESLSKSKIKYNNPQENTNTWIWARFSKT